MLDELSCCMLSDDLQRYLVCFACDAIVLEQLNSQENDRQLLEYNTKWCLRAIVHVLSICLPRPYRIVCWDPH